MKGLKLLLCFIISGLCLLLIFRKVDLSEALHILKLTNSRWVFAATTFGVFKSWLTGFRCCSLVSSKKRLSSKDSFYFYGIGVMINMTLPFRAGDLARARLIAEALKIPGTQALGTIVSEHILDFTMLCCLLFSCLTFYSYHWPTQVIPTISTFFILTVTFLIALLFWKRKKNTPFIKQIARSLNAIAPKQLLAFPTLFRHFYAGLFQFDGLPKLFKILGATILIWLAQALWIYALLHSLGLAETNQLRFEAPLVLVVMMGIAVMIPSSPGYIGTFHLIILLGLTQMGVSKPEAFSFAILAHAHAVSVAILVGLYSLWKGNIKLSFNLSSVNKPAATQETL